MELSFKLFLCMAVCMTAKINFGDCRFCSISVKTARQVSFCPTKKSQAIQASERLRCDKLALIQNCTSPANFKYHCVMNVYENATLEVCAPEWYISGYCAEFNMEGGRIQPHFNMKCMECPTRYKSSDAFHYEYCYKMIQKNQKEKNSLSKSSVVTMTNETSGDKSPSSKNREWFTWTIAIAVPLLTGAVLICIIVIFRKRKSQDRLENTNQDEQGNPLLNRNAREMNTIEIEITEDEAEHKRDNIETKLKTLVQDLGILFFKELERLKTGTDISNDTCNLIETELRNDDENDKDEENNEKEVEDKSKIKLQAEQQLLKTKAILNDWLRCNTVFELLLISIIDEMENRRKGVNIATITGSSIGVVGALLTGIGILGAPVTAGISLGLAIAGGVISTAGAVTSIGAKITEIGLSRKNYKTISRYKLQMSIFSNQLEDNLDKLLKISELIRQDSDHCQRKEQDLLKAAPCIRALVGAGSIPLVVLRALSRAVVQAEAVFIPLSLIIDIALGIIAIRNLKQGSVTPESLKLRTSKHQLRLTRQQMFAWAFGNSEELEEKEEADFQDT